MGTGKLSPFSLVEKYNDEMGITPFKVILCQICLEFVETGGLE